jgi:preprotein translocase subunit Sss1
VSSVSSVNATEASAKRPARHPLQWIVYLTAIGIATVGWIAFLSYCALALLGY